MLQLYVFGIPQHVEQVARREVADSALSIIVGPAGRRSSAKIFEGEAAFVYALEKYVFRILIVLHVVLLVGNCEVVDPLRYRMIRILHFYSERSNRWMPCVSGPHHVAKVGIGQADMRDVVQE